MWSDVIASAQAMVIVYSGRKCSRNVQELISNFLQNNNIAESAVSITTFEQEDIAPVLLAATIKRENVDLKDVVETDEKEALENAIKMLTSIYKEYFDNKSKCTPLAFAIKLTTDLEKAKFSTDEVSVALVKAVNIVANATKIPGEMVKKYHLTSSMMNAILSVQNAVFDV